MKSGIRRTCNFLSPALPDFWQKKICIKKTNQLTLVVAQRNLAVDYQHHWYITSILSDKFI